MIGRISLTEIPTKVSTDGKERVTLVETRKTPLPFHPDHQEYDQDLYPGGPCQYGVELLATAEDQGGSTDRVYYLIGMDQYYDKQGGEGFSNDKRFVSYFYTKTDCRVY